MHCGEGGEEEEQTFARYLASLRTKCWKNSIGKLQPRADGPFQVLKRINDNTYKIDLPSTYNVSATFNVADLSTYVTSSADDEDEEIRDVEQDSRANLFQAREHSARRIIECHVSDSSITVIILCCSIRRWSLNTGGHGETLDSPRIYAISLQDKYFRVIWKSSWTVPQELRGAD
ncbi:hypothetical protein Tco_0829376 [Tanacetum coccineum]